MRPLAATLIEGFSKLTWHEASSRLMALDVWHNRVGMPYQMMDYTAASHGPDAGILVHPPDDMGGAGWVSVKCPVFLSDGASKESPSAPPRSRL